MYFYYYVKNAAAIHALCPREADDIAQLFETKKIITVPNGVDENLLQAATTLQPAKLDDFNSPEDIVLGFVGRIDIYHKGLDLLLEAMSSLKKNDCSKVKLFIVGPYHTNRDEEVLCSLIKEYGLEDIVLLAGPKFNEEKWRYFLACDVFVHTSRFEGMPMAVLEAMALGKPCLVTPGSNVAQMVLQGGGWQCGPEASSIAEAIENISEAAKESIKASGRKSYELVEKEYKWVSIAEKLRKEYDIIVRQAASRDS